METRRNPCCSGPTASTGAVRYCDTGTNPVAIPVVVDLLLRHVLENRAQIARRKVAIPVVVDLLLRLKNFCLMNVRIIKSQSLL